MTHEAARRFVSRLWLLAFAGVTVVFFAAPCSRAGELALEPLCPGAPFTVKTDTDERSPVAAFCTEGGVYELDTKTKTVRVWPKALRAAELKTCRLNGVDSSKKGVRFSTPVSLCKKPGENVFAVVDACPTVAGLNQYSRIAFFSFAETSSDGVLSSVSFTFLGEIRNAALSSASDVAFFPSGDKVAVSISRFSSGPSNDDQGAIQFYAVPTSADAPVAEPDDSFLCVRTKNVYEGSVSNTGAEPYNVPVTGVCVDPDGERIWTASKSLSAVIRYDPVSANTYDEVIWIRTWEFDMLNGPWWNPEYDVYFPAATADFVQGALGVTNLTSVNDAPGFNVGDIGMSGVTNNLLSLPGSIQLWESPNGNLLVVADTDNDRVVAFDEAGNARFTFNAADRQEAKFRQPRGAWVSDDGTELVVADTGNGRVEVFQLTEADSALDETIDVTADTPFFWETDTGWFTNWIVATTASMEDRAYTIRVDTDPAGCVAVEEATVTLPAGAMRVPFAIRPLDGAENGTVCTLTVSGWETNAVFAISNKPPSVRTGPPTATNGVDNGSYMYIDEGTVMDVSNTFIPIDMNPGLLLAKPDGGAIHFHAKAFDVAADAALTYEWRVIGTKNTLLDPVYRRTPFYWCEYEEGVPPATVTKTFTPEESEDFPTDSAGNRLYLHVRHDPQAPDEDFVVTNVLSYAETTNRLDRMVRLDWAAFLYDDEQGADFVCFDDTLTGPDATFSVPGDAGVTYFAILTVTDKDGGVWRSLSSPDESYVCFGGGGGGGGGESTAVYSARFTKIEGNDVTFVVTLLEGTPAASDAVYLEAASSLGGPWSRVGGARTVGSKLLAEPDAEVEFRVNPAGTGDIKFYRVVR